MMWLFTRDGNKSASYYRLIIISCLLWAPPVAAYSDLRLLVDVSGSMTRNDPNNLRVPALRLVSQLAPEGTKIGVWLFAARADVLLPVATVDSQWRQTARELLARIHSRGQFTDIEAALLAATADWITAPPDNNVARHVVLLTDGLVDVQTAATADATRHAAANAASRARILETLLPQLQQAGVTVHVVALSDQVDAALVTALTQQTHGWLEQVQDASALQRAFLRILEQGAPPTTAPLRNNRFTIDAGVREFTLLAFRQPQQQITLITPNQTTLTAAQPTAGVVWQTSADYDLITITAPAAGEWQLQGSVDSDNQVALLTDLDLATTPPPTQWFADTPAWPLTVWLTNHGQRVNQPALLAAATAQATLTARAATTPAATLPFTLTAATAQYHADVTSGALPPGEYTLHTQLISKTFQRQRRQHLRLAPAPVQIKYTPPAAAGSELPVTVTCDPAAVKPASVVGYITLAATDHQHVLDLTGQPQATATYQVPLPTTGVYQATARVHVTTQAGQSLMLTPPVQSVTFTALETATGARRYFALPETVADWTQLALYLLGSNVVLIVLFALWHVIKRRQSVITPNTPIAANNAPIAGAAPNQSEQN